MSCLFFTCWLKSVGWTKQTDLSSALRVSHPMKSRSMTSSFTLPDGTRMDMWIMLIGFFPFFHVGKIDYSASSNNLGTQHQVGSWTFWGVAWLLPLHLLCRTESDGCCQRCLIRAWLHRSAEDQQRAISLQVFCNCWCWLCKEVGQRNLS
jgi:hypothetical protein